MRQKIYKTDVLCACHTFIVAGALLLLMCALRAVAVVASFSNLFVCVCVNVL